MISKLNDYSINVLHINCNYIYTSLHQLMYKSLVAKGMKGIVYSPIAIGNSGKIIIEDEVVSECFSKYDRLLFFYKQKKIFLDIKKKIDIKKYSIIHAYTLFTDGNVAFELSKAYGIPYVCAVRDTDVNVFLKKIPYLRKKGIEILLNAHDVFFLSKTYYKYVLDNYIPKDKKEMFSKKSHIIPNGIDSFWLDNKYYAKNNHMIADRIKKEKCIKLIYVGAVSKRKNVKTTVKAVEIMNRIGWNTKLVVIGEIQNRKEYSALVRSKYTQYLGKKEKKEISEYLRNCDIFVMPSITETFGLSYAEALSQGVPVIYSKGQGFDGQYKEGIVGYHVNSHSAKDIVKKILRIAHNYIFISNNAIRYVDRFNWDEINNKYIEIYIKIISECGDAK